MRVVTRASQWSKTSCKIWLISAQVLARVQARETRKHEAHRTRIQKRASAFRALPTTIKGALPGLSPPASPTPNSTPGAGGHMVSYDFSTIDLDGLSDDGAGEGGGASSDGGGGGGGGGADAAA